MERYLRLYYLSIPIIINNLIQTLYNLVDGIWVSKISSVHLQLHPLFGQLIFCLFP